MTLVDTERAEELYQAMGPGIEQSGGSAANTMAGIASFGGTCGVHRQGPRRSARRGVRPRPPGDGGVVPCPPSTLGVPTGRCLIVVTPDAQRTMNTYLGVSELLGPDDVDTTLIADARRSPTSRATSGTSLRGWPPSARPPRRRMQRAAGYRSLCPTRSASTAIATEFLDARRVAGRRALRERGRDH